MDELPKLRLDLCPAPLEQDDDDDESVEVASYNGLTLCEGDVLGVLDDISTDEDEDKSIAQTCLREMEEEIGIGHNQATVLGVLRCNWGEV